MKRTSILLVLALVAGFALPAAAKKKNAPKMTCEEFAASTPEAQTRAAAYLDGYTKGGTEVTADDEVEVDRQLDMLVVSCTQEPKASLWDKLKAKMPGGKKKVKPVAMTCEEFLALSSDVQPEVAYWLAGYNAAKHKEVAAAGEVDLETDTAVLIEECKPAPKESLWDRIKKKF
jgi:hypothetical protein